MAGYYLYSKSNNAVNAEVDERYPLTKASGVLSDKLGWTRAKAKDFLLKHGTSEYHHTSKFYNKTDYYDVSDLWIADHDEEIKAFEYIPKQKSDSVKLFKCWNIHSEPRQWDWKITNRDGNNTYAIADIFEEVKSTIKQTKKALKETTHKSKVRCLTENLNALESIVTKIKEIK